MNHSVSLLIVKYFKYKNKHFDDIQPAEIYLVNLRKHSQF